MRKRTFALSVLAIAAACTSKSSRRAPASWFSYSPPPVEKNAYYEHNGDFIVPGDTKALLGRDIWIKATAGNSRFFAYAFPQRISGKSINWPDMLRADKRAARFEEYGLINDPDCCSPIIPGDCKSKFGRDISPEETYEFDYCPGDGELLKYVGHSGYRDPACDLASDEHSSKKQNACDLEFGTSTGTIGLRKFPNPRFNVNAWIAAGGWKGYINFDPDASGIAAIDDHSLEPPFRIGMACAHCHAAFNPVDPPANPAFPKWSNINALVGNQYLMDGQIWGSGYRHDHITSQSLSMSRAGTVDTSAVPNDFVGNPGTQNAIINLHRRPYHVETVNGVPAQVPHILKGGEDSAGYALAVQRVYFNIGSCSEQCWLNHLTNPLEFDSASRNYDETPFDINQCRRDCPNFRAIEDRVEPVLRFFYSSRPTDMKDAKDVNGQLKFAGDREKLKTWLENDVSLANGLKGFGPDAVRNGARIFARSCASCHSSQKEAGGSFAPVADSADPEKYFLQEEGDPYFPGKLQRIDWLGNDKLTPVNSVGTNSCRSRHSNHMKGNLYEQFASDSYRAREPVATKSGPLATSGRGYYRNVSLLSVWAHAPFLHNNSVGPELCGNPDNPKFDQASYLNGRTIKCQAYDPTFEGRFRVFLESINQLLTRPDLRDKKALLTTAPVRLELIPKFWKGYYRKGEENSISLIFPTGLNSQWISSFRHKEFLGDLSRYISEAKLLAGTPFGSWQLSADFQQDLRRRFGMRSKDLIQHFALTVQNFIINGMKGNIELDDARLRFYLEIYSNCMEEADNLGHDFGTGLTEKEKNDLIAFLSML